MMKWIDTISYSNRLRDLSAFWKCGLAALLLLLAYLAHPLVQLAIFGWLMLWTIGYAKVPAKLYMALLFSSCLLFVLSLPALLIEFTSSSNSGSAAESLAAEKAGWVLASWEPISLYVPEASLGLAGPIFTRILACLACMFFITLTTPFPELLQVLKRLKMPQIVLELMIIMYRFIFLLLDTAGAMLIAQRARGGQHGFRGKLQGTAAIAVRLFVKTMHRYKGLSNGLMARGFTNEIRLAPAVKRTVRLRYWAEAGLGIIILLAAELWLRYGGE
ncbi:cobalt ECF transporter T component CbiQ [Paenibacillus sp. FSL H8-0537]|uniref:cobalt ECF transporter T component CbiQ n=1 Tax=Paenibacillus sp. FSL H8-0537 TaxID=2921399 RepID=UPI003100F88C